MAFGEPEQQTEKEVTASNEDTVDNIQPHVSAPVNAAALEDHMQKFKDEADNENY